LSRPKIPRIKNHAASAQVFKTRRTRAAEIQAFFPPQLSYKSGEEVYLIIGMADISQEDFYWLTGLMEGEGSFLSGPPSRPHSPVLVVQMCDLDVVQRIAKLWGVSYSELSKRRSHYKTPYMVKIRG
jgi:hypothetical protein